LTVVWVRTLDGQVYSVEDPSVLDAAKIAVGVIDAARLPALPYDAAGAAAAVTTTTLGAATTGSVTAAIVTAGANADTAIATQAATDSSAYARRDLFVNVLGEGVMGDCNGTAGNGTDDTAAINAAITANPGKTLLFPAGRTYRIRADLSGGTNHGGGIVLNQPGTVLWAYGATFVMDTSTYANYQMVDVAAADCAVFGGKFVGDVVAHTGTVGEFGCGLNIAIGADRFKARDVYVTKCWGDGFTVWQRPVDVSLTDCTADDNRRNGLSVIDAVRPRIIGGAYINSGLTKFTAPGEGIDIEPDAATTEDVIDALVSGVMLSGNKGAGFNASGNTRTCTALVVGCKATGNTTYGYRSNGSAVVTYSACEAKGNGGVGFYTAALTVIGSTFNACTAIGNQYGFQDLGTRSIFSACVAVDNLNCGLRVEGTDPIISDFLAIGNANGGALDTVQIHLLSPNTTMTACVSRAGSNAVKPSYGFVVYSTATGTRLFGCDASGAFVSGAFLDQTTGNVVTLPKPGTAKAAAITTPTSDTVGTKAAIDAIRAALIANGITA